MPKIAVSISIIAAVSGLLMPIPAQATETNESVSEFDTEYEHQTTLIESNGKWARQYAIEMLEQYPKLQTNPYAVLVSFTQEASPNDINELIGEIGAGVVDYFPDSGMYLLETVEGNINARNYLSQSDLIEFVEFDRVIRADNISNDPRVDELWGLTGDHGIRAEDAWAISTSANEVIVAVIDSGVDIDHPDLSNVIWQNQNEIPGNGIDDDKNGYIDDIHGWDFANNDASVFDHGDGDTHGTHVAGIISSIIGDNPLRKIMVLKFINRQGGTVSGAINAIKYAVNNGAKISNHSYGLYEYKQYFEEAIEVARHHNHLLIAAAGNDARTDLFYPASFEQNNIISVAASNENHQLAYFSNRGIQHVDIAAPGNAIYSTLPGGQYGLMSGTSMASPLIAGIVGLGMSLSSQLSLNQLKDTLLETSTQKNAFIGQVNSNGIVNADEFISSLRNRS